MADGKLGPWEIGTWFGHGLIFYIPIKYFNIKVIQQN